MSQPSDVPPTRTASPTEVVAWLATGNVEPLIGVRESATVEFKGGRPYDLSGRKGKGDLVSDIASFANAQGGVIVAGAEMAKHPTENSEYCCGFPGVASDFVVTLEQLTMLVREHCHPPVHGLELRDQQINFSGDTVRAVSIVVPPAAESDRPVLVNRLTTESGENLSHAVGWPTRHGDGTHWEQGSRIRQLVDLGMRRPSPAQPTVPVGPSTIERHRDELLQRDEWIQWPLLLVALRPESSVTVNDFYGELNSELRGWQGLRPMGFNFWTSFGVEQVDDELILRTERMHLSVSPSGVVVGAAPLSPSFLGHAANSYWDRQGPVGVNSIAVAEFIAETLRIAYDLVGPRTTPPVYRWAVEINLLELRRTQGANLVYRFKPFTQSKLATSTNDYRDTFAGTGSYATDGYTAVANLFGRRFGVPEADLPSTGDNQIDPAAWTRT